MPLYPNVASYTGHTITPLKPPDATGIPNQRGPSCGFYALGYALAYWYEKTSGTAAPVAKPLPPRTQLDETKVRDPPRTTVEKHARKADADTGQFTSLRQYGKHHNLTQHGSVFNAEAIVRIAEGASKGDFSGHVILVKSEQHLLEKVKGFIDKQCPVIIPYDVDVAQATAGDPMLDSGKAAHWTTIVGYDESPPNPLAFLHYMWGAYYRSLAGAFAASCCCLTSNINKNFLKCEIRLSGDHGKTWKLFSRDWMATESVEIFDKTKINDLFDYGGTKWKKVSQTADETVCDHTTRAGLVLKLVKLKPGTNMEYCDPVPNWWSELDFSTILFPDYYKKNFVNPGLRGKLVAVYPASKASEFR